MQNWIQVKEIYFIFEITWKLPSEAKKYTNQSLTWNPVKLKQIMVKTIWKKYDL